VVNGGLILLEVSARVNERKQCGVGSGTRYFGAATAPLPAPPSVPGAGQGVDIRSTDTVKKYELSESVSVDLSHALLTIIRT
jgi:hypothetical protein